MRRSFIFGLLAALPTMASTDIPHSTDPDLLKRYPRSSIIQYREFDELEPYMFVFAPVEKIKREVIFEGAKRVQATWKEVTYEIPPRVDRVEVVAHYMAEIERTTGTIVFSCEGRDCGRATSWFNDVFKQPKLAAPDRNQHYVAASWMTSDEDFPQILLALYVVERGNGKVFAHIEEVRSSERAEFDPNVRLADELAENGIVQIRGLEPTPDGAFSVDDLAVVRKIASKLARFSHQSVYVVCHIFGVRSVERLIEGSRTCAKTLADEMSGVLPFQLVPFGAGPLVPISGQGESRIELVIPVRINRSRSGSQ